MSVDTTILILKNDGKFYTECAQAAENITDAQDADAIAYHIEKAKSVGCVSQTLEQAMVHAEACEMEHERVCGYRSEYGIRVFNLDGPVQAERSSPKKQSWLRRLASYFEHTQVY